MAGQSLIIFPRGLFPLKFSLEYKGNDRKNEKKNPVISAFCYFHNESTKHFHFFVVVGLGFGVGLRHKYFDFIDFTAIFSFFALPKLYLRMAFLNSLENENKKRFLWILCPLSFTCCSILPQFTFPPFPKCYFEREKKKKRKGKISLPVHIVINVK